MEGAYYLSLMVGWLMVFNTTFNNISGISWRGGNRRKPPTCRKSMTNFITYLYPVHLTINGIQTHNVSGDRHWLHK